MAESKQVNYRLVVIGGGIAGVTCAETLSSLCPEDEILLVSASPLVKTVTNFKQITKSLAEFDVKESPFCDLHAACPNVKVQQGFVTGLISDKKEIILDSGNVFSYEKLCICTGGVPKIIAQNNPLVLGIRDTETVAKFQEKLTNARRIIVVGNGGIATELVYEIEKCEVIWAIKDKSISSTFVDEGAARFFLPHLAADKAVAAGPSKRRKYTIDKASTSKACPATGSALGPDWSEGIDLQGSIKDSRKVHVEYEVEISRLLAPSELENMTINGLPGDEHSDQVSWPLYVHLTNDKVYGCDFLVSATGVTPNTAPFLSSHKFLVSDDGGILVNDKMETSLPDVFAAGDVCTADWTPAPHWIQMRLWSQARQQGAYAAKSMVSSLLKQPIQMDFCFELFAHVTKFFGYKVVLLGRYNAQGLGTDHYLLLRLTRGVEYIKVVMKEGRMQGAVLIGETDLEETFENLILNQMDLSQFGEDILDPNIDIDDFFD